MKRIFLLAAVVLVEFYGCQNGNSSKFTLKHTGEPNFGWLNTATLMPDNADPANSVSVIDSASQYSLGYRQMIKLLSDKEVKEIVFQADVKPLTDNSEFSMVISVESGGNSIMWEGAKHNTKAYPANKWSTVQHSAKLPLDKIDPNAFVTVYVWNNAGKSLVDNVTIEGR